MITNYIFNDKSMYVVGDIHGEFKSIKGFIKSKKITNSVILFAGDVGIGFYSKKYYENELSTLNKFCKTKNITLLYGRGNHDDKSFFSNEIINYSNVKTIPDYSVISILNEETNENFNCVYIGGAISIDRKYRIATEETNRFYYKLHHSAATEEEVNKNVGRLYWPDEPPVYEEEKLLEIVHNFDTINYVVSHTAPSFCFPLDKNGITDWLRIDSELEKDVNDERNVLSNVYKLLKDNGKPPKGWVYGHFHKKHQEQIDDTMFTLLDCVQHKIDVIEIY